MKKQMTIFILSAIGVLFLVMVLTRSCFYSINQPLLRQTGERIGKSSYYYGYGIFRNNIYYWSNTSIGETPKKLEKVDCETFVVIDMMGNSYCAKDKNAVYYGEVRNTNVDVPTFEVLGTIEDRVIRDKNYVYNSHGYAGENQSFEIVPDGDPVSFQALGNGWAKDSRNVYLFFKQFDADPLTFSNINRNYSKDRYYLYYQTASEYAYKERCNTDELTLISNGYIRTNTRIYYLTSKNNFVSIPLKDTASIEVLDSNRWLKADGKIVFDGQWLNNPDVDESTFSSLGMQFFKDKNHIYYWQWNAPTLTIIREADLNTFEIIGEHSYYAKDKNHVYYKANILPDANPNDFQYDIEKMKGYSGKNVYKDGEIEVPKKIKIWD